MHSPSIMFVCKYKSWVKSNKKLLLWKCIFWFYPFLYALRRLFSFISIHKYLSLSENNRMKIKDIVLRFTQNQFCWSCFSSVYKGYHFILLIWRCLGIKYWDDVILSICYFRSFCDLSLSIEQRFEFIYEIIFIRFS